MRKYAWLSLETQRGGERSTGQLDQASCTVHPWEGAKSLGMEQAAVFHIDQEIISIQKISSLHFHSQKSPLEPLGYKTQHYIKHVINLNMTAICCFRAGRRAEASRTLT